MYRKSAVGERGEGCLIRSVSKGDDEYNHYYHHHQRHRIFYNDNDNRDGFGFGLIRFIFLVTAPLLLMLVCCDEVRLYCRLQ